MMKNLEEIRLILREHSQIIQQQFQVAEMLIFGSYAREQQTESSDVDILISYEKDPLNCIF